MKEKKRRILEIISLIIIVSLLFGYPTYFFVFNNSPDIKHETNQWMLIRDNDGNKIAVEAINSSLWDSLTMFYQEHKNDGEPLSFKGVVVSYENSWQFRLDPSTIYMGLGFWKMETYTINEITSNLELYLSTTVAIYFTAIQFNSYKNTGVIPFSIDMIITGVSVLLFGIFLFFKRERTLTTKIKETLLAAKENPDGISFSLLSQNVGLKQQRIKHLLAKNNLKENLNLQITNDLIQFKEMIYSQSIHQIKELLPNILQLAQDKLTIDHYGQLSQFKTDLEDALVYFSKNSSNLIKETQIKTTLVVITDLLDSITLDSITEKS
ncbi:MAG: hypothetical protein ACTSR1_06520 [Candidatus Heimdallarchaeota archaeon]